MAVTQSRAVVWTDPNQNVFERVLGYVRGQELRTGSYVVQFDE
jgi:hypothetical protein